MKKNTFFFFKHYPHNPHFKDILSLLFLFWTNITVWLTNCDKLWIFILKTGGFEKKNILTLVFFNSVFFKKKTCFFFFFFKQNTFFFKKTLAYDMSYYVKLTALSIKAISRPLLFIVLQISAVRDAIIKFTIYFNIGYKLNGKFFSTYDSLWYVILRKIYCSFH